MGRTMNDAAKWWYYVRQNGGYYPQTVANLGYDVWDWSTLNASTLFQDSAKTTPASANGDVIGCWTDGVSGVDATQATTANKPTYTTASLNGLPTISFDGSDLLATGNIAIGTFAVWVVLDYTSGTLVYEHGTDVATVDGMLLANNGWRVRRGTSYSRYSGSPGFAGDAKLTRHVNQGTNANHKVFTNGAEITPTSNDNIGDTGTATATQPFFIGARSGVLFPITGNIGQLLIVSPYPTAEIIASMESYINNQWNGVY